MGLLTANVEDVESKILYGLLLAIWIRDSWEAYLVFRQWRVVYKTTTVPDVLDGSLSVESLARMRLYYLDMLVYLMVFTFFDLVSKSVILLFDVLSLFWLWGVGVGGMLGIDSDNETLISILFMLIVHIAQSLYMLPFNMYLQIIIGNRYRRDKKTFRVLLIGSILICLLKMIVIILLVPVVLFIVRLAGDYFFFSLWALHLLFVMFVIFVFMGIMAPSSQDMKPLEDGELKDSIEVLADRVDFPLAQIYVYKTPELSTESNAFFYGCCGNKRIVLYDNLIDLLTIKEILGVVAHELGHWKGNHVIKNFIMVEIYHASIFAAAHFLFPLDVIYRSFNFLHMKPIIVGLIIVFDFIFIPYEYVCTFLLTFLTRHFEYDADAFAKKLGEGRHLRSALIHLKKVDSSFPVDDWLFSLFNYDHPSLLERLRELPE